MSKVSRRSMAQYAANQLISGKKVVDIAKRLASLLVESGRAGELEFLLGDIKWELERRGELAAASVTTAKPLTEILEAELKAQIKKALGTKEVQLEGKLDKSTLGGIRIETASRVWDSTVDRQLRDLREAV